MKKAENRHKSNYPNESMLEAKDINRESRVVSCDYNDQSNKEDL
jgi:hypothetical protein